jgi:hypothetical protein
MLKLKVFVLLWTENLKPKYFKNNTQSYFLNVI